MTFLDYWFNYIFIGYQKWGEKYSAHFYALCILTILMACNVLSMSFFTLSDSYLKSKEFKIFILIVYAALISVNAIFFLRKKRYLKMISLYHVQDVKKKSRMKLYFWIYFIGTFLMLILSFLI